MITQTIYAFGLLLVMFLPLERLFPGHRQKFFRREWGTDLLFFLGQFLLWNAPVVVALTLVYENIRVLPIHGLQDAIATQPIWLQFLEVILISDLLIYWAHRLSHSNRFLWRFHRVHHTSERIDWIAAYREHPFDNLYTRMVENLPLIVMGFPLHLLAGFAMFRGMWAVYIHSNVALTPGPLRYLIGAPRLHHWHHAITHSGRVNFANLSPLMDLMFGTFHDPGHMPRQYGVPDRVSHNYFAQLIEPFRPRKARGRQIQDALAQAHRAEPVVGRPMPTLGAGEVHANGTRMVGASPTPTWHAARGIGVLQNHRARR